MGYEVVAFEPTINSRDRGPCEQPKCQIIQADYEQFVATILKEEQTPLSSMLDDTFDAVLLGWGSLAHVFSASMRAEVIEAAARIAPNGPILGSLWCRDPIEKPPVSPLRQRAAIIAQTIAQLRGLECPKTADYVFDTTFGFAVYVTPDEMERIADDLGRTLRLCRQPYAHFTMSTPTSLAQAGELKV